MGFNSGFKGLNAKLNPICHLLALLGAYHILHISRIRVNLYKSLDSLPVMNLNVNTKTGVSKTTAVNVALQLLLSLIFTCLLLTEGEAHRSLSISLSTINYVSLTVTSLYILVTK